jgi:hypothetical protein
VDIIIIAILVLNFIWRIRVDCPLCGKTDGRVYFCDEDGCDYDFCTQCMCGRVFLRHYNRVRHGGESSDETIFSNYRNMIACMRLRRRLGVPIFKNWWTYYNTTKKLIMLFIIILAIGIFVYLDYLFIKVLFGV